MEQILLHEYERCISYLNRHRAEEAILGERGSNARSASVVTMGGAASGSAARHGAIGGVRAAEAERRRLALLEPIRYMAYDFNTKAKTPGVDVLAQVTNLAQGLVESTGFFPVVLANLVFHARRPWKTRAGCRRTHC